MSDLHSDLMKELDKGRRVIFTKLDRPANPYVCVVEDEATGRHIATSDGGNPYTALFDASAIELWSATWPDAPGPGLYPPDVKEAMDREDWDYVRSRANQAAFTDSPAE